MSSPRSPPEVLLRFPYNSPRVGRDGRGGKAQEGLEHRAALKKLRRARAAHQGDGGRGPTYVPSEANTVLLAEALRVPVGPLLEERERLFERWHCREVVI